jgi:hypothetical protein
MSEKISIEVEGKRISGRFVAKDGMVTVPASDGRTTRGVIEDSMLGLSGNSGKDASTSIAPEWGGRRRRMRTRRIAKLPELARIMGRSSRSQLNALSKHSEIITGPKMGSRTPRRP